MTNIALIIVLYVSDIKSADPRTMLYGGEGFLFIMGKAPVKTTYKKTLYKLLENERKVILPSESAQTPTTMLYRPNYFLRIESTFYLNIDETSTLAYELSYSTKHPKYKWTNCRWKHNLLNNDIILDTPCPTKDITLVIKKLCAGTASFAYETYVPDYIVQPTSPVKDVYLIDHLGKTYPLSTLNMDGYCDWNDISSQYI